MTPTSQRPKAQSGSTAAQMLRRNLVPLIGLGIAAGSGLYFSTLHKRREAPLAGKVVFITGGSRGLGLAMAEEFLRAGCRVAIAARDREQLDKAEKKLQRGISWTQKRAVFSVVCDVTDPAAVAAALEAAARELGDIDILVNNAGIITVAPVSNQPLESYHQSMNTNYYGALNTTLAVLPRMRARRAGTIVNIASIGGLVAVPHLLPYTASKFAMVGLSRGLNAELRADGVHVLTVCPWLMRTGSHLHAMVGGKRSREYAWFALGASLPYFAVSAKSAAQSIVEATAQRRSELLISPLASAVALVGQNAPELMDTLLGLVNRVLPSPAKKPDAFVRGKDTQAPTSSVIKSLTQKDAAQWNQH